MQRDINSIIEYVGQGLTQDTYYYVRVSENKEIHFMYDKLGNEEKPFLLDNNCRLNHVPILRDIPTNNLKPIYTCGEYTEEESKAIASKGGTNSRINEKRRKTFRESLETFLSLSASQNQLNNIDSTIVDRIPTELKKELTQEDLINLKALELAQNGSNNHLTFIRDTIGEKPTDKAEISAEIMTDNDRMLLEKIEKRLNNK